MYIHIYIYLYIVSEFFHLDPKKCHFVSVIQLPMFAMARIAAAGAADHDALRGFLFGFKGEVRETSTSLAELLGWEKKREMRV